ncbi:FAD binding domain-containing protein [Thioalkalivibrio sp. HK1]|uniref:FAD binding domain-containing protein n=1 Tax=Thioalkalivibrio sp. HK1 TaxID=1469245 RepID=UPI00046ED6F4|nr:xanthine dehydrogenase family protein subunit M [Thioalkalivibrio sp. HK1]
MYSFGYFRPSSVEEALTKLNEAPEAKMLAGGQTLLPTMKQRLARPSDLIDLAGIESLRGIRREGHRIRIGAMVRHSKIAESSDIRQSLPGLAALAADIGDPQVRNLGTIGGSVANADPAADYPAALVALDAIVHTHARDLPADTFFTGMFETALDEREIITGISFPLRPLCAYRKFPNPASRYPLVGVFIARALNEAGDHERVSDAVRVAVTGAGSSVFRVREMEKALCESFTPEAISEISVAADDLNSDIHAGGEYRAHLITVMAMRAVADIIAARSNPSLVR